MQRKKYAFNMKDGNIDPFISFSITWNVQHRHYRVCCTDEKILPAFKPYIKTRK